jgi:tetratricopeptide (TPR) repeat protein
MGAKSVVLVLVVVAAQEYNAALTLRADEWLVRQRLVDVLFLSDSYKSALSHLLEAIRRCDGRLPGGTLLECFPTREEFDAWVKDIEEKLRMQPLGEKLEYSDRALLLGYAYYSAGKYQDAMMILAGVGAHHKEAIKLTDMAKEAMKESAESESKKGK